MSCRCHNSPCPDESEVTLVTLAGDTIPEYTVEIEEDGTDRIVNIQTDIDGYWLFRIWLTDGVDVTDQETLHPPDEPGAASFFKVTNLNFSASTISSSMDKESLSNKC